ncbi:MAG: hypothetical protein GEV08_13935 [Acidimicrobiia bacterium]|nr:hypothetical protein [Acidimicrobiia bacterium]
MADMAIHVVTKDCTALSDADLDEMADLSGALGNGLEIGVLSKEREAWVLITLARRDERLVGFSFCTLERIGGTPSVLIGLAAIERGPDGDELLHSVICDQLRRAVLAFPDEDVLVGTRFSWPDGFDAYAHLEDVVPRPEHKASGEERAWGRRLAKRFGIDNGNYEDRVFIARGDGMATGVLDYRRHDEAPHEPAISAYFESIEPKRGDALVVFGWAMAEYLETFLP